MKTRTGYGYHVFFEDGTTMLKEDYQKILDSIGVYAFKDKTPIPMIRSSLISEANLRSYGDEFVMLHEDESLKIYATAKYNIGTYLEGLYRRKIPRIFLFIEYDHELFVFYLIFWNIKKLNPHGYSIPFLVVESLSYYQPQFHQVDENYLNSLLEADEETFLFLLKIILNDEVACRKDLGTRYTNSRCIADVKL